MPGKSIEELNFINHYDRQSTVVETISVESNLIKRFSKSKRICEREIKKINLDSLENSFRVIRRLFFLTSSTLNDFNQIVDYVGKEDINEFFKQWKRYDLRSLNEHGKELYEVINQLYKTEAQNELNNQLTKLIKENESNSIIISKNDFDLINQNDEDKVIVSPTSFLTQRFQNSCKYSSLIFIGTPRLFPLAFRTIFFGQKNIYLSYDVFLNKFSLVDITEFTSDKISKIFANVLVQPSNLDSKVKNTEDSDDYFDVSFGEYEASLPLTRRKKLIEIDRSGINYDTYEVNFFSGHYGFFPLKAKFNELTSGYELKETKITDLKDNAVVIFRETNQKEILIEKAAKIIGENSYYHYWNEINYFRDELKKKFDVIGVEGIKDGLDDIGIRINSGLTIKNWLSETIKPNRFLEIMESYLGIGHDKAKKIYEAASSIKRAHLKAGRNLTAELNVFLLSLPENSKKIITKELGRNQHTSIDSITYGTVYFEIIKSVGDIITQVPAQIISEIFER